MDTVWIFTALLITHWVGDFVLQTRWQGENKSKRLEALSRHVASYTAVLMLVSVGLFGPKLGPWFALANDSLHFTTDYFTSRITSRLYAKQSWYLFWIVIGFDQLLHQIAFAATLSIMILRD